VPLDDLMACGVPVERADEVRRTTADTLLDLAEHLPAEAAEALLAVTDRRAAKPDHAALATIYRGVRARAKTQVAQALPRLGDTIESLTK